MKERLINNLGLKLLSIFLAFFVWLVVLNVSNPEVTRSKEVTVEIENEQVLTSAGKTYEVAGKNTVTVMYEVRARDEYRVRSSDFRAYIDLTELYDVTGSVPVKVEVINNKELINNAYSRPTTMRVETEDLQTKLFEISAEREGEPENGYALSEIILDQETISVRGPVSQVGQISSVGIRVDLTGINETVSGIAEPVFFDANGNELTLGDRMTVGRTEIGYTLVVHRVKNVNLNLETSGQAAEGYRFTGAECERSSIAVEGLQSILAEINSITIPGDVLSVEGMTADRTVLVDLTEYLPEGVTIIGPPSTVTVTLKVEPLVTKTLSLSENEITKNGTVDGYMYRIEPRNVNVTVRGLAEDLEMLSGANLGALLDVTGMELGQHAGVLAFSAGNICEITNYEDFTVTVSYREPGGVVNESGETEEEALETEGTQHSESTQHTEAAEETAGQTAESTAASE